MTTTDPPPRDPLDQLRTRLGMQSTRDDALLAEYLDAASAWVTRRVGRLNLIHAEVQEAILLMASRLYKRRQSPEGVAGWDDLGVVRITTTDPDIERLLAPHIDAYRVIGIG